MTIYIIGIVLALAFVFVMYELIRAPEGFEDKNGFHITKKEVKK